MEKANTQPQVQRNPVPDEIPGIYVEGHLRIFDPNTQEELLNKRNAIHFENMSLALAQAFTGQGSGIAYSMAFGNGGSTVDPTGVITYLPTNTVNQNAELYHQTYEKVVNDTSASNPDPSHNFITVNHISGKTYTDVIVTCLLDFGEPLDQQAFDNATQLDGTYIFDEIGLKSYQGLAGTDVVTRLITHVIFHPIQKSLNRQIQIEYTIRLQTLTNLSAA